MGVGIEKGRGCLTMKNREPWLKLQGNCVNSTIVVKELTLSFHGAHIFFVTLRSLLWFQMIRSS